MELGVPAMNLNGRSSLDPRWVGHHTSVVAGFMLATIKVVRVDPNGQPTYNYTTKTWDNDGLSTVFEGKARIQPFGIMGDMVVGQDTTSRRLTNVQIDNKETGINVDDILYITDCPEAPELREYALEVRGAVMSSNAWVTTLVCEVDTKHAT